MDLKKWQKGLKLYFNAEQLRDDGEILMENGSYRHLIPSA